MGGDLIRLQGRQETHEIAYASHFNADGSKLAVGDSSGTLTVYNVFQAASVNSCASLSADSIAVSSFNTRHGCIYAIHSEQETLICGTDRGLIFTKWEDLKIDQPSAKSQCIQLPSSGSPCEVNAIAGFPGGRHFFAAAGDGNAYAIDLQTMTLNTTFKGGGSLAYLHCIAMRGTEEENVFLTVRRSCPAINRCHFQWELTPNVFLASGR